MSDTKALQLAVRAIEGFRTKNADLEAEVARLQTALKAAEAQSRLRGEALEFERQISLAGDTEAYPQFVEMRDAAIDISPKEAREKETRP